MAWRVFRSAAPRPLSTEACLAQTLRALAPQVEALQPQLPPALWTPTVAPLLHRLTAWVWDLPASEAHHHSRPYGLLTHSFEVATQAARALGQSSLWWQQVPDPAQKHQQEPYWRLGTVLAGLLHDTGKMFDLAVTITTPTGLPVRWDPLVEPLLTFLLAYQHAGALPPTTQVWQPRRGMQHEAAGTLAALLLLTPADLQALSLPVARALTAFLGGTLDPGNLFRQLLVQPVATSVGGGRGVGPAADGHSVQADLATIPPAQPSLALQALDMLGRCCREQRLRVNQFPGQVFVQGDETLLVVPRAFEIVREHLATEGVTLPRNDRLHFLYSDLADAGYVLGPVGQNVVRAAFLRAGKDPVRLAVLRVPTAMLWPQAPPASYAGEVVLERPATAVDTPLADDPVPLSEEGVADV